MPVSHCLTSDRCVSSRTMTGGQNGRKDALRGLGTVLVLMGFSAVMLVSPAYLGLRPLAASVARYIAVLLGVVGALGGLVEFARLRPKRQKDDPEWSAVVAVVALGAILYFFERTVSWDGWAGMTLRIMVLLLAAVSFLGLGVTAGEYLANRAHRHDRRRTILLAEAVSLIAALISLSAALITVAALT